MTIDNSYIITVESKHSRLNWDEHFRKYKTAAYEHDPLKLGNEIYLHILRVTPFDDEEFINLKEE